jgi:acetyl-CoA acetyltransferase
MNEIVLVRPVRTAIGTYRGSLKSVPAVDVHGHIREPVPFLRERNYLFRDD